MHFAQYGVLSYLIYRAFSHRVRAASIYWAVILLCAVVAMVDEFVQWLTPKRYWGGSMKLDSTRSRVPRPNRHCQGAETGNHQRALAPRKLAVGLPAHHRHDDGAEYQRA
jgi:hypothetical protein